MTHKAVGIKTGTIYATGAHRQEKTGGMGSGAEIERCRADGRRTP